MALRDYYDWVHEAQDLYGMTYRDAQALWQDVSEEIGDRPTFDSLYDPTYDVVDVEDVTPDEDIEIAEDRAAFADYDVGAYEELESVGDFDEAWYDDWFEVGDEIEVTVIYEEAV